MWKVLHNPSIQNARSINNIYQVIQSKKLEAPYCTMQIKQKVILVELEYQNGEIL